MTILTKRIFYWGLMGCLWFTCPASGVCQQNPVVVELFESQGCSSCPPSEHVMSSLKQEFGESVILLTFHVDYWDYLGWKDVFSDARWTDRQKRYGQAFGQDSIYTPEMVIDGQVGFVGSAASRAEDEVRSRLTRQKPAFSVTVSPKRPNAAEISVHLSPELAKNAREILAIVVEDAPAVHVLRGENRGETMTGDFAVRSMAPIFQDQAPVTLTLPADGNPLHTRVVVLVTGTTKKIIAAQWISWLQKESRI